MEQKETEQSVQQNIDRLAADGVDWSRPVTHEEIVRFQKGDRGFNRFFLPAAQWLEGINGKELLCLAGAGGQQAPLLAAAGASVTLLDLSEEMLRRDREVALRESLDIRILGGSMNDLTAFPDGSFDLILNPPSLMYVPDVLPVYRECGRVLKKGGILILSAPNPLNYIWEYDEPSGQYIICNSLPYRSFEHENQGDWIEYGYTLQSYMGGLTDNGFCITGFYEEASEDPLESFLVIRAMKL